MTLGEKYPFTDYAWIHRIAVKVMREMRKLPAPNSPNGTHYMVEIDPVAWSQMQGFIQHDYFVSCFNGTFSIGQLKGSTQMYLMVHANDLPYFSVKPLTPVKVQRLK